VKCVTLAAASSKGRAGWEQRCLSDETPAASFGAKDYQRLPDPINGIVSATLARADEVIE
jgi:hypothetical protein